MRQRIEGLFEPEDRLGVGGAGRGSRHPPDARNQSPSPTTLRPRHDGPAARPARRGDLRRGVSIPSTIRAWRRPTPLLEEAPVGDLVRERVLEGVFEVREEARLVEELGGLEVGRAHGALFLGLSAMADRSANGTSLPMTAADWSRRLSSGERRSIRAARMAWTVGGTWMSVRAFASRYAPRSPTSALVSTSARTLSSRKKGLPSVRSIRIALEGLDRPVRLQGGRGAARPHSREAADRAGAACRRSCCPSGARTRAGS